MITEDTLVLSPQRKPLHLKFTFFSHPTWAVWLTLLLLFFGNRSEISALFFWGRYLPTVGIGILIIAVVVQQILLGRMRVKGKHVIVSYAVFVLILLVSAAYNASSSREIVLSLVTNLRYPLFFIALLNADFPPTFYRRVIWAFVVLTLLQVPVSLVQFFQGQSGDWLTGTMGANGPLIAIILISQCVLLVQWLVTEKRSQWHLFAVMGLMIPILLGDVGIGLIFVPLLVVWIVLRYYGLRRLGGALFLTARILPIGVIIVASVISAVPQVQHFAGTWSEHSTLLLDWSNPSVASNASVGRLTIIPLGVPLLMEDPLRLIWGFGPEAANGGLFTAIVDETGRVQVGDMGVVCQRLADMDVVCREPQSFRALMEFGFLGTLLYLYPLLHLWRRSMVLRRAKFVSRRYIGLLFDAVSFLYVFLGVWYVSVWRVDSYSFAFWLLSAAVYAEINPADSKRIDAFSKTQVWPLHKDRFLHDA